MMNTVDDKSKNAIFSAIEAGDLSAVQLLLAQDNGIVFHEYKDNRVAIHFAVKQFKSEIVNFLLELGPEKVIRFDSCNLFSVLVWSWVDLNEDHDESEMLATFDVLMKFSTELNHPAYLLLQPASLEFFSNLEVQTETPSPDDPLFNRFLGEGVWNEEALNLAAEWPAIGCMAKLLRNGVDQGASTCDRFLFCDGSDPSPAYWLEVLSSMFAMGLKLDSVDAEIGGKSILTHAVENMDAVVAMALYVQGADMTDVVELKKTHREWLSQFEFGV